MKKLIICVILIAAITKCSKASGTRQEQKKRELTVNKSRYDTSDPSYLAANRKSDATRHKSEGITKSKSVRETNKRVSRPTTKVLKTSSKDTPTPPRDILNFELSDVIEPSPEYEKLYKARNLGHSDRVKRSAKRTSSKNSPKKNSTLFASTTEFNSFVTLTGTSAPLKTLPSPPEVFKFELSDAKTPDPSQIPQRAKNLLLNGNSNTTFKSSIYKRESSSVSIDQKANDSRKIRIINPLANSGQKKRSVKYQAYEELPFTTQKIIDKAIANAYSNNKLNNGEYLQFYYGDKIIITPFYPKKPEPQNQSRAPVNSKPSKGNEYESFWVPKQKQKFKLANDNFVLNPKLLGTKQSYIVANNILKPKEAMTPKLIINVQPESNVNYKDEKPNNRPEQNAIPNVSHLIGLSPSYEKPDSKKAVGPILFHPEPYQPKPEEVFPYVNVDLKYNPLSSYQQYKHNFKSVHMSTPQLSHFPLNHMKKQQSQLKLPPPTSYQELINYNLGNQHEEKEDYEFGYKVTDFKSGNNFGHVQKSEKNGITRGQYHILLPDGRKQVVKYYADDDGFHADVTYEKNPLI